MRCFLPACLPVEWVCSSFGWDSSQTATGRVSRRGLWMCLRRIQPELPCFCGCQALRGVVKGELGKSRKRGGQDSVAGSLAGGGLGNSSSPQLGRLSTESRQGHPGSWATCDASTLGRPVGRRMCDFKLKCFCNLQGLLWHFCVKVFPVSLESQTEQALESQSLNKGMGTALSYGESRPLGHGKKETVTTS